MEGGVGVPSMKGQFGEEARRNFRIRLDPVSEGHLARAAELPCAR